MTMAGLTEYPDLFKAGADLFGVVNFETFFANTEPWMAAISTMEYGDPKTQPDLLRRLSPMHKVDQVKAATIVLHGANDTNVPVVEAEQVVSSLKQRGVPVQYVLFPDEGHGWRKLPNRIRYGRNHPLVRKVPWRTSGLPVIRPSDVCASKSDEINYSCFSQPQAPVRIQCLSRGWHLPSGCHHFAGFHNIVANRDQPWHQCLRVNALMQGGSTTAVAGCVFENEIVQGGTGQTRPALCL